MGEVDLVRVVVVTQISPVHDWKIKRNQNEYKLLCLQIFLVKQFGEQFNCPEPI